MTAEEFKAEMRTLITWALSVTVGIGIGMLFLFCMRLVIRDVSCPIIRACGKI